MLNVDGYEPFLYEEEVERRSVEVIDRDRHVCDEVEPLVYGKRRGVMRRTYHSARPMSSIESYSA